MKTAKRIKREAKKLYQLCLIHGLLDEGRVRQVVAKIIEARRRSSMALLSHFQYLVKLDAGRHKAQIATAVPLPEDLQTSIRADLARVYGPGISASFAHEPELIGGMRIKVGSDVYDGSVRAALAALEKSF